MLLMAVTVVEKECCQTFVLRIRSGVNLIYVTSPVVNSSPEFLEVDREGQCSPFIHSFMRPISQSLVHSTSMY